MHNILFILGVLLGFYLPYFTYFSSVSYFLGSDLISYGLIFLRIWICALIILSRELVNKNIIFRNYFLILILFLLIILYLTFSSVNLFLFYVFFESSLIPTLLLILWWGYQPERLQAGLYLLFYTLLASLPLLISIFYI